MKFLCNAQIDANMIFKILISVALSVPSLGITFYEGKQQFSYNCSVQFTSAKSFSCVCLSGIWRFFSEENCDDSRTVGGSNYCERLPDFSISRLERITDDLEQLFFSFGNGSVSTISGDTSINLASEEVDSWVTASSWTLHGTENITLCLSPSERKYCIFTVADATSIIKITKGCGDTDTVKKILPETCNDIMMDVGNVCQGRGSKQGRTVLFAPGMKPTIVHAGNATVDFADEDFYEKIVSLVYIPPTISHNKILTEVWNELHSKVDEVLQLSNGTKKEKRQPKFVAAYNLLELSAEVMKKSCPDHYVKGDFLDLSVRVFNNILRSQYTFTDTGMSYDALTRVSKALINCINATTPFNFTKDYVCSDNEVPEGNYIFHGMEGTIDIEESVLPEKREAMIETVWNIFYNAHSLCFNYFDETYNDHHRFTTLLFPLFQMPIVQEIWNNPYLLTNMALGGLFGNQLIIQKNLAFCAASSRLESEYPWDLKRPKPLRRRPGRSVNENSDTSSSVNSDQQCLSNDVIHCKIDL